MSEQQSPLDFLRENVRVVQSGGDLYVGLIVPGRGFCSSKILTGFNPLAVEWERRRCAAVGEQSAFDEDASR